MVIKNNEVSKGRMFKTLCSGGDVFMLWFLVIAQIDMNESFGDKEKEPLHECNSHY